LTIGRILKLCSTGCWVAGLPELIDLEFDLEGGRIYWTDRGDVPYSNKVNRAKIPKKGGRPSMRFLSGSFMKA